MDDSSASGILSTDLVIIGDKKDRLYASTYFVLANNDTGFDNFAADGVLGLGFNINSDGYPTFIDGLKNTGLISHSIFGMYLNSIGPFDAYTGYGTPASNLEIGGYNLTAYSTSNEFIATANITNNGYWSTTLSSITMGNHSFDNLNAIFDSGIPFIIPDSASYLALFEYLSTTYKCVAVSIAGLNLTNCPCTSAASMPGFNVTIGADTLEVPSSSVWYYSKKQCLLLMTDLGSDFWIMGVVFLQNFYTVYDMDNLTISFAPAVSSNYTPPHHSSSELQLVPALFAIILSIFY